MFIFSVSQKENEIEDLKAKNLKLEGMLTKYAGFEAQLIEFQERFRILMKEKLELESLCKEKDQQLFEKIHGKDTDQKVFFLSKQVEALNGEVLGLRKALETSKVEIDRWRQKYEEICRR